MFYIVLIVIALLGAYYVGDCYPDRFFTSGEIWTGMMVGMLLPVWVALKKREDGVFGDDGMGDGGVCGCRGIRLFGISR